MDAIGKINVGVNRVSVEGSNLDKGVSGEQRLLPHNAWVLCDDCQKWRRISAALADQIGETNCTWYFVFHITPAFRPVVCAP